MGSSSGKKRRQEQQHRANIAAVQQQTKMQEEGLRENARNSAAQIGLQQAREQAIKTASELSEQNAMGAAKVAEVDLAVDPFEASKARKKSRVAFGRYSSGVSV